MLGQTLKIQFRRSQISPSFLKNHNQINFIIAYISNEKILDIINSLENKSTGPCSIPEITSLDTRSNYNSCSIYH